MKKTEGDLKDELQRANEVIEEATERLSVAVKA
jgi:hypothetical protein